MSSDLQPEQFEIDEYYVMFGDAFPQDDPERADILLTLASIANDMWLLLRLIRSVIVPEGHSDPGGLSSALLEYYSRLGFAHLREAIRWVRLSEESITRQHLAKADALIREVADPDGTLEMLGSPLVNDMRNRIFHYGYGSTRYSQMRKALKQVSARKAWVSFEGDDFGRYVFADEVAGVMDVQRLGGGEERRAALLVDGLSRMAALASDIVTEYLVQQGLLEPDGETVSDPGVTLVALPLALVQPIRRLTGRESVSRAVVDAVVLALREREHGC